MKIYTYNKETGEFIKEREARPNPRALGRYLVPANATKIKPPAFTKNKVAVFIDGAWVIKSDFRGSYYTNDGTIVKVVEIDEPRPAGVTIKAPPVSIQKPKWTGTKWIEDIDKWRQLKKFETDNEAIRRVELLNPGKQAFTFELLRLTIKASRGINRRARGGPPNSQDDAVIADLETLHDAVDIVIDAADQIRSAIETDSDPINFDVINHVLWPPV
jgi:hypothetical protein